MSGTVAISAIAVAIGVAVRIAVLVGEIPDLLDRGIHAVLEQTIQAGTLLLHLTDIGELSSEGDGELVAGIARQTDLLGVIAF